MTILNGTFYQFFHIFFYLPYAILKKYLVRYTVSNIKKFGLTNAVAVMYSRNMPMTKKRIVCLQSKYVGLNRYLDF